MPRTVEQIVEETRTWSEDQIVLLVHRLGDRLHDIDPQIEEAWRIEAHRRLEDEAMGTYLNIRYSTESETIGGLVFGDVHLETGIESVAPRRAQGTQRCDVNSN